MAEGLLRNGEEAWEDLKDSDLNENLIFKNTYDALRSLLQSFLIADGWRSYSHEATLQYAFENGIIDQEEHNQLDKYRKLRNDIEYRGARVTGEETKKIISLIEKLLPELRRKFERCSNK